LLYLISLVGVLAALWLLLSGHFSAVLLGFGACSIALVVWIAHRMDVVDPEGHPSHLSLRAMAYWPWLIGQIVAANLAVTREILRPRLAITPTVRWVRSTQRSDLGRTIFANSITLTPGTVSIEVAPEAIQVHALTRDAAEGLETGEMDRRVSAMESTPR